jgi:hypothetical protein
MKVQADIQGHYDGGSVGSDGGALCQHLKKKKMMKRERMTVMMVMIVELVSYYYIYISMRLH